MKKIYNIALAVILLCGCDSFLDVTPKGKLIPEKVQDFDELIGDPLNTTGAYSLVEMCSDNIVVPDDYLSYYMHSDNGKAYTWQEEFYSAEEDDMTWNEAYKIIYTCNLVLQETPKAKDGSEAYKAQVMAEAKVNRAYYYWFLHSCYAPAYNSETASTDLSVPLVLNPDLEAKVSRATSQKVVEQILKDLDGVAMDLPLESISEYHISRKAAYGLAARVNLFFGNYDAALENAEEALKLNSELFDYNTLRFYDESNPYEGVENRPQPEYSPEMIMYRSSGYSSILSSSLMSPELLEVFDTVADLRYKFNFTTLDWRGNPSDEPYPAIIQDLDYNIGVPEMLLIKAECLARRKDATALEILNTLRKKRLATDKYVDLQQVSEDKLLEVVLAERQRELAFNGLRFFDMKRLAKEGIYTRTLIRRYEDTVYTLEPNSNRYLLPIAKKVRLVNSNIVQNPR